MKCVWFLISLKKWRNVSFIFLHQLTKRKYCVFEAYKLMKWMHSLNSKNIFYINCSNINCFLKWLWWNAWFCDEITTFLFLNYWIYFTLEQGKVCDKWPLLFQITLRWEIARRLADLCSAFKLGGWGNWHFQTLIKWVKANNTTKHRHFNINSTYAAIHNCDLTFLICCTSCGSMIFNTPPTPHFLSIVVFSKNYFAPDMISRN